MGVVSVKSAAMTNATATPKVLNSANLVGGNLRESQASVTITSGDSTGSIYYLFPIKSSDRLSELKVYSPDIGTTTAGDVGLYRTADEGGAVVDVDAICSALSLKDGALNGTDITFEATSGLGGLANAEKRVWECISGLTVDPHLTYIVALTLTGDADAGGAVLFRMRYVAGE